VCHCQESRKNGLRPPPPLTPTPFHWQLPIKKGAGRSEGQDGKSFSWIFQSAILYIFFLEY